MATRTRKLTPSQIETAHNAVMSALDNCGTRADRETLEFCIGELIYVGDRQTDTKTLDALFAEALDWLTKGQTAVH